MTALPRGHRASVPPLALGVPFVAAGLVLIVVGLRHGVGELLFAVGFGTAAGLLGGWWLFGARKLHAGLRATLPPPEPRPVETEDVARTLARFGVSSLAIAIAVGVVGLVLDADVGVLLIAFGVVQLLDGALVLAWERRHDGHRLVVVGDALRPVPR